MNLSRRSFLETGSKLGLAAIFSDQIASIAFGQQKSSPPLGSGIGFTIPKEALNDPLYSITRAMFAENLRTKFTLSLGGVRLTETTLIEVNDLNPPFVKGNGTSSRECFSVVFQGPRSLPLRQDTYSIEHSRLGRFKLLLVPGDPGKGSGLHYGAVINRVYP
jgi:Domain of unknown function (DUF6916)